VRRFPKLLAFAAGLASATGFAPLNLWPVTLVALAVTMWLVADAPNLRGALVRGYVFGLGHFIVGLNWIAGAFRYQDTMPVWLGWVAVVALAIYIAVYPAMAAGLAWRWGKPLTPLATGESPSPARGEGSFVLIFAAAWIATEYLRATMFTGFAWNPLGVVLVPTSGDGVAKIIGTYGLSGCVILVAGALLHRWRLVAFPAVLAGLLLVGWLTTMAGGQQGRTDRLIRVVQPNIGQQDKQDESFDERNWAKLAGLTGPPGDKPRLILWPEAAVPYFLEEERWARYRIAGLMGPQDVILTGGDAFVYDKRGELVAARNSLFMLTADGALRGRYDKAHLVPYGEYLPMRPLLSAIGLSRLVPGDLDFLPGPGPQTYALPGFGKVGVQICYEIIFSGEVIDKTNRPDFLFNPSNDAWFGAWGPPQHLAQARLRAIEEGMPVVRSTPTGISAVIDADGQLLVALPLGKAGFIQTRLPAPAHPTLFARFGNVLPFGFALTLIAFAVALHVRKR
jgi:apolipoprotein N-acyltransferase